MSSTYAVVHSDRKKSSPTLSLKAIFLRFKWRITFTFCLVTIETLLELLFPLFIGWAINDLLTESYEGIYLLFGLGVSVVVMGSARRFYDTRIYAHIYQTITPEMVLSEKTKNTSTSTISARSNLLTEFVEFFENSMPEVITSVIGLFGVLLIIASLNLDVFLACFVLLVLVVLIYLVTGKLNYRLNAGYNSEFEKQVAAIEQANTNPMKQHFRKLMSWNIRLSDLETSNFFLIWIGAVALLVYAPISAIDKGAVNYGLVFSLLMYVFDYIEKVVTFPLFVQQMIRLKEISNRLNS